MIHKYWRKETVSFASAVQISIFATFQYKKTSMQLTLRSRRPGEAFFMDHDVFSQVVKWWENGGNRLANATNMSVLDIEVALHINIERVVIWKRLYIKNSMETFFLDSHVVWKKLYHISFIVCKTLAIL